MNEIIRLYWTYRAGNASKEEAIAWALTRVGISNENREWAYQQVITELRKRQSRVREAVHAT